MIISGLGRIMPAAAKLGTKTVLELVGAASIGAGVVSFAMDKGTAFAKEKLDAFLENKKQELILKKAAIQAANEEAAKVVTENAQNEKESVVKSKRK